MHLQKPDLHSRRAFLKRAGQLAATGTALPVALNLAAMGEAAAFNSPGDYKALVCVFLYGANDFANTVVTYDNLSAGFRDAVTRGELVAGDLADVELLAEVLRTGFDAVMHFAALAYVGEGIADAYYESGTNLWDVAAGLLMVREAGGQVSDISGKPYDLGGPSILASNTGLHDAMVEALG